MEWTERGVVLTTRKHGENDVILEVMTRERGRHLGLVRAGRSRRHRPFLQPGNELTLAWKARLSDHLGQFQIEPERLRAADLMVNQVALTSLQHLAYLIRLLPERHPYPRIFDALAVLLDHLEAADTAAALIIRFELELLQDLGAGLDLTSCAATGRSDDLTYVSPRSARAVSREAGQPYHDKLLPLPAFLLAGQRQAGSELTWEDVLQGFGLTSFFLDRHLEDNGRTSSDSRALLLNALERRFRVDYPWNF